MENKIHMMLRSLAGITMLYHVLSNALDPSWDCTRVTCQQQNQYYDPSLTTHHAVQPFCTMDKRICAFPPNRYALQASSKLMAYDRIILVAVTLQDSLTNAPNVRLPKRYHTHRHRRLVVQFYDFEFLPLLCAILHNQIPANRWV